MATYARRETTNDDRSPSSRTNLIPRAYSPDENRYSDRSTGRHAGFDLGGRVRSTYSNHKQKSRDKRSASADSGDRPHTRNSRTGSNFFPGASPTLENRRRKPLTCMKRMWQKLTWLEMDAVTNECIIHVGRLATCATFVAFVAMSIVFIFSQIYHELPTSSAPVTLPTLSEATNVEPARSIMVVCLMTSSPLLILVGVVLHVKLVQLFSYVYKLNPPVQRDSAEWIEQTTRKSWFQEVVLSSARKWNSYHLMSSAFSLLLLSCGAQFPLDKYRYAHCTLVALGFLGIISWCFVSHRMVTTMIPNVLKHSGLNGDGTHQQPDQRSFSHATVMDKVEFNLHVTKTMRTTMTVLLCAIALFGVSTLVFGILSFTLDQGSRTHAYCTYFALPLCEYALFLFVFMYATVLVRAYKNTVLRLQWPVGYPTSPDVFVHNKYHKGNCNVELRPQGRQHC
jgi:hypothetical protein